MPGCAFSCFFEACSLASPPPPPQKKRKEKKTAPLLTIMFEYIFYCYRTRFETDSKSLQKATEQEQLT